MLQQSDTPTPPRLLVVEDEPAAADVLQTVLRDAGYQVEHAADGATALARVNSGEFTLALVDLVLPDMDGLELCRQIRTAAAPGSIYFPIIIVTARGTAAERRAGFAAGASDYVLKPFDPGELLGRVDVWIHVSAEFQAREAALREQQAARQEAERRALTARLEGVLLAAREITARLNNDLQAPVSIIDLLLEEPRPFPPPWPEWMGLAKQSLDQATLHLRQLQQIVRVETKQTPLGLALDLQRSSESAPPGSPTAPETPD